MNIGVARIVHKSNSFARTETTFDHFRSHELLTGEAIAQRYDATGSVIGGALSAIAGAGATANPLVSCSAQAGGPVTSECIDQLVDLLIKQFESGEVRPDGLIIELSGAMTVVDGRSGDEQILSALRSASSAVPVVVVLSNQANLSDDIVDANTILIAPSALPDSSPDSIGARVIESLLAIIRTGDTIHTALERLPVLIPLAAQRSTQAAIRETLEAIANAESDGSTLRASLFLGYPYADIPIAGASVVVQSTSEREAAATLAARLREELWSRRSTLFVEGSNIEEAVHHAMAAKSGTVLIADLGDNPDDGAPGDGTTVLWALLDLGVRDATIGAIADEQAVDACIRAGVDSTVEIPIGGRRDTRHGYPIDVRARVKSIHDGCVTRNGPIGRSLTMNPGRVVVLDVEARHDGHVELILTERPIQITDTSLFDHVGIDPRERSIISIKSTNDYIPAFEPLASAIFEVITPGITTPDPAFYEYRQVRRPMYPLDPI